MPLQINTTLSFLLLSLVLLLTTQNVRAQRKLWDDIPPAKKFYAQLKRQKVDTVLIYGNGCIGCEVIIDEPAHIDTNAAKPYNCICPFGDISLYFIWTKNGRSFLRKFDYCTASQFVTLDKTPLKLYNFYNAHLAAWRKEKEFWASKKIFKPSRDHYSFYEIYFKEYQFFLHDERVSDSDWAFATWQKPQMEWVNMIGAFVKSQTFVMGQEIK